MNSYERIYEALISEVGETEKGQERIMALLDKRRASTEALRKSGVKTPGVKSAIKRGESQVRRVAGKLYQRATGSQSPDYSPAQRQKDIYRITYKKPSRLLRATDGKPYRANPVGKAIRTAIGMVRKQNLPTRGK